MADDHQPTTGGAPELSDLDVAKLLEAWGRSDEQAGHLGSETIGHEGLAWVIGQVLAEKIQADEWDLLPSLSGVVLSPEALRAQGVSAEQMAATIVERELDEAIDQGREPAPPEDIRAEMIAEAVARLAPVLEAGVPSAEDEPEGPHGGGFVVGLPLIAEFDGEAGPRDPREWMPLKRLPGYCAAAFFFSEMWLSLKPRQRAELAPNAPRDAQGRVEVWHVVAVNRSGEEVYAYYFRGGPDLHLLGVTPGAHAPATPCPCGLIHAEGSGGLVTDHLWVDGLRRMLGLQTRNRVRQPYVRLLDHWAGIVEHGLAAGPIEPVTLVQLLDHRIDWALTGQLFASGQGSETPAPLLSGVVGLMGIGSDEAGLNQLLLSDADTQLELESWLVQGDRIWEAIAADTQRPLAFYAGYLEELTRRLTGETGPALSPELVAWMGPQLYLAEHIAPRVTTNAAGRLARDGRLPGWFRDSITRALNAASAIELH
jgi:hypothetical protein